MGPARGLPDYQRHKVRVLSVYDLGLGRIGTANLGAVHRYDSPQTYSLFASNVAITAAPF